MQSTAKVIQAFALLFLFSVTYAHAATPAPKANPLRVVETEGQENNQQLGLAPEATANLQKKFTLEGFFAGSATGRGTIFSKTAGVARTYNIVTSGTWDGKVLTLVETYQYSFGSPEQRVWRFTKTGEDSYLAESSEIRKAVKVKLNNKGASLRYEKDIERAEDDKKISIVHREAMTLRENGLLEIRTGLRKFVAVGSEKINLVRVGNEAALADATFD